MSFNLLRVICYVKGDFCVFQLTWSDLSCERDFCGFQLIWSDLSCERDFCVQWVLISYVSSNNGFSHCSQQHGASLFIVFNCDVQIKPPNIVAYLLSIMFFTSFIDFVYKMGQHLSEPITTKETTSISNSCYRCASSCMQGWRVSILFIF